MTSVSNNNNNDPSISNNNLLFADEITNALNHALDESNSPEEAQQKFLEELNNYGVSPLLDDQLSSTPTDELNQIWETPTTEQINQASTGASRPVLTTPSPVDFSSQFSQLGADDAVSLISLMAAILILQAKSSADAWKTSWQMASQQMKLTIDLAPIIAEAIRNNYDKQAEQSKHEAKQALIEGIVNIAVFCLSICIGAMAAAQGLKAAKGANDAAKLKATADTGKAETALAKTGAAVPGVEGTAGMSSATKGLSETEQAATKATAKVADAAAKGSKTSKWNFLRNFPMVQSFVNGAQISMLVGALGQGITKCSEHVTKMQVANCQKAVGQWQAFEKQLEAAAQYFNQAWQQTNSALQGQQTQVDKATEILQQIAQMIANAISQGFSRAV